MEITQLGKLATCRAEIPLFIKPEGQIQKCSIVLRITGEHLAVLPHSFVVSAFMSESHTKIGAGFDRTGSLLQQRLIQLDGLRRVSCIESTSGLVIESLSRRVLAVAI